MPAGIEHPVLGYLAFCGVKAVGYTVAAKAISHVYQTNLNSWGVGLTRTLIGMAAGGAWFGILNGISNPPLPAVSPQYASLVALSLLGATRIAEWWLLIWLFYDRHLSSPRRGWIVVLLGVLWSFALDFPAIIGWFVVGGFWVC
jgi:hypothetical protein